MSDLPKDQAPEAHGRPDETDARAEPWAPDTDAGRVALEPGGAAAARGDRKVPARRPARPSAAPAADELAAAEPADAASAPPGERIAKAMARAGIASRRDAEAMILEGRVRVNGAVLASPALNVTDDDDVLIDGAPMPARERSRLWVFHKPRGLVTTARDPEGRQTVFEILPEEMPRVVAIGRLDINTEGLLLLTNDGGLAKVIAHPDTGWLRRYRVRAHGDTDQAALDRIAKGVTIDGMEYGPVEATLDRVQGDNLWLTLGLREGKNREVKRILEHLGLSVNRLIRLSFGPFQLGDLEVGLVEEVRTRVLKDQLGKTLSEQAGVDFESPVREPIAPFGAPKPRRDPSGAPAGRPAARPRPERPAPAPRAATGGAGSGPRRSAWRAEGDEPARRAPKVPRRGADPRAAQAASAERGRERVGSIRTGERRVVVERLAATPQEPAREEAPRRRYADRNDGERPARPERDPRGGRAAPARAEGKVQERAPPRDAGRPPRAAARPRGEAARGESGGERPGARPGRSFDAAQSDGPPRGKPGFRDRKPAAGGGKPAFGGAKPAFGGGKSNFGGAKPGAGGFRGGKPGAKPGGPAGRSPGGKPGGFRGGAKPGGGRPPRAGR